VAVVNQALVKKFFKGQDPIGKFFGDGDPRATRLHQIVGVAKDALMTGSPGKPIAAFFFFQKRSIRSVRKPRTRRAIR
jgi:hypothetical protein